MEAKLIEIAAAYLADELPNTHFGTDLDGTPSDIIISGYYTSRM